MPAEPLYYRVAAHPSSPYRDITFGQQIDGTVGVPTRVSEDDPELGLTYLAFLDVVPQLARRRED